MTILLFLNFGSNRVSHLSILPEEPFLLQVPRQVYKASCLLVKVASERWSWTSQRGRVCLSEPQLGG